MRGGGRGEQLVLLQLLRLLPTIHHDDDIITSTSPTPSPLSLSLPNTMTGNTKPPLPPLLSRMSATPSGVVPSFPSSTTP